MGPKAFVVTALDAASDRANPELVASIAEPNGSLLGAAETAVGTGAGGDTACVVWDRVWR